ncbi:MAG: FIVAR domain-containing protein, partial [Bifidobacteriaceae bacterium]|jgi:hypothetical protein|nr:FIVAR domain-containing protein [Bifidobacteriaceae bacterium]
MFITRGSYAGQHFATAWSGDINNTSAEIDNQIGFQLDAGLVGYWTASHDLGGFMGRPNDALYTRWTAEFGAWNGLMRTHGHDGREPWTYNTLAQNTLRDNLKIRYALYPYIYTTAWQGYSQGIPMMRAMILEDDSQTNPAAWNLNRQYYFGDWFLVAPASATVSTTVPVWLPPNTTWYNYFDGLRYEGGATGASINVAAALNEIPVFVKAGAIVPMGPEVDYADEVPLNPLTLDIYPSGTSTYTLYEDDGETRRYLTQNAYAETTFKSIVSGNDIEFQIDARHEPNPGAYGPPARDYNLKFNHVHAVTGVSLDATALPAVASLAAYDAAAGAAYWADSLTDTLYVKLPDDGAFHSVRILSGGVVEPALGETNQAPPPPLVSSGDLFEAEDATMGPGVARDTEWKGYTGTGFAKGFQNAASFIEFQANIVRGGTYDVSFRVTNGKKNSAVYDNTDRTAEFLVDSALAADLAFPVTPTWGDSSKNGDWRSYPYRVQLTPGVHTFRVQLKSSGNTGNFNLDSLKFDRVDTSVDAFSQIHAVTATDWHGAIVEDSSPTARITEDGAWLKFAEVRGENKADITLRVASTTEGTLTVHENGVGDKVLGVLTLPTDGGWHTITIPGVDTDQVESDIFIAFAAADPALPVDVVIDWFKFNPAPPTISSGTVLEWEDGTGRTQAGSPALRVDTEWKGYSGRGYVAGWKDVGDWAEVTANVTQPGMYTVSLRIGAGTKGGAFDATPRTAGLYVDGAKVADLAFDVNGPWGDGAKNGNWETYAYADIELTAGLHDFKVVSEGTPNPGNFNLDSVRFQWDSEIPAPVEVTELISKVESVRDVLTAGYLVPGDYTGSSWTAMTDALDQADVLLGEPIPDPTEAAALTAAITSSVDGLVRRGNVLAVEIAYQAGLAVPLGQFTQTTADALATALAGASSLLAGDRAEITVASADGVLQAISTALSALVPVSEVSGLSAVLLLADALDLVPQDYTPSSWQAYLSALAEAEAVMALGREQASQTRIDAATVGLRDAIVGLTAPASTGSLTSMIGALAALGLTQGDYTPPSWATYAEALRIAQAVLGSPDASQANITAAEDGLRQALAGLRGRAQTGELNGLVATSQALRLAAGDYTPDSWAAFTTAFAAADAVAQDPTASQSQIDAAGAALRSALAGLVPAIRTAALAETVGVAAGLDVSSYSPASVAALTAARLLADAQLASPDSQSAVDQALGGLKAALVGLRPALMTRELHSLVLVQESLNLDAARYTTESWAAYAQALAAGRLALTAQTSQQNLDDAATALREAVLALELVTLPTDPPTPDPPTDPPTDPPATDSPTDPPVTDPPTDPPATDPPATDPPATDPPATDPPATDPPATDPPATDPPANDPPSTDPPATDPPATDPPSTDPPASNPPTTTPPTNLPGGSGQTPPVADPPQPGPLENPAQVIRVRAAQKSLTLVKGSKLRLAAAAYTRGGSTAPVKWSSSKPSVAKVSSTGVIRALKAGRTTITLSAGGLKAKIALRVIGRTAAKVTVTSVSAKAASSMKVGQTAVVTASYKPAKAASVKLKYSSSRPSVLTVDSRGVITAKAPGKATITVKAGTKTKKLKVTVK